MKNKTNKPALSLESLMRIIIIGTAFGGLVRIVWAWIKGKDMVDAFAISIMSLVLCVIGYVIVVAVKRSSHKQTQD